MKLKNMFNTKKKAQDFGKFNFFFLGITSLMGWNAVLSAMDFFQNQFEIIGCNNVSFYLPIPLFIAQNIAGLFILHISQYITLNQRIALSYGILACLMIIIPISSYLLPNLIGFYLCIVLIFILGFLAAVGQSTGLAFTSIFFKDNYITMYITGSGFGGVLMGLIRLLCLLSFGDSKDNVSKGTIIYFIIAAFFLVFTIIFHFMFRKTAYCRYYLKISAQKSISRSIHDIVKSVVVNPLLQNTNQILNEDIQIKLLKNVTKENSFLEINEKIQNSDKEKDIKENSNDDDKANQLKQEKSGFQYLLKILIQIMPMPFMIWLIYTQTFMLFPGLALKKQINGLSPAYQTTLIVLTFNFFDTLAKYLTKYKFYNKLFACILVICRFIFYASFIIMVQTNLPVFNSNWFPFLNMALFGFTNGYATNAHMCLGPEAAQTKDKEAAGFLMAFPLYFGITSGSLLGLVFQKL